MVHAFANRVHGARIRYAAGPAIISAAQKTRGRLTCHKKSIFNARSAPQAQSSVDHFFCEIIKPESNANAKTYIDFPKENADSPALSPDGAYGRAGTKM